MGKLLIFLFLIILAYNIGKDSGSKVPESPLPTPPSEPAAFYNWRTGEPIPESKAKDYIKIDGATYFHKDSIPPGTKIPKWIKPTHTEQKKYRKEMGLTEDDVRQIINEELD